MVRGLEGIEVGFGDVAAGDLEDFVLEIAFGGGIADPEGAGADAEGVQLGGQPLVVDGFAFGEGFPGPIGQDVQAGDQVAGEEAVGFELDEADDGVEEQAADGAGVFGAVGEGDGGLAGAFGPVAAGEVGNGEEGLAGVGQEFGGFGGQAVPEVLQEQDEIQAIDTAGAIGKEFK